MCLAVILLNLHAWRQRDALRLDAVERVDTRGEIGAWLIVAGAGLGSVFLALIVPANWVGAPGWVYMTLPVIMPLYGRRTERRRRLAAAGDGTA